MHTYTTSFALSVPETPSTATSEYTATTKEVEVGHVPLLVKEETVNDLRNEATPPQTPHTPTEPIIETKPEEIDVADQVKEKKPRKAIKKNRMLADLQAFDEWHSTLPTSAGRPRGYALKIQEIREAQLAESIKLGDVSEDVPELTPEEEAEIARKKEEKRQKAKEALEERKRQKLAAQLERKEKAKERKRLIAEGIIKIEPKQVKDSFYSGSVNEILLKSTSHFVNIGAKFDETAKRQSKPPQRMVEEITEARKSVHKGRTLKQSGMGNGFKKRKQTFDDEQQQEDSAAFEGVKRGRKKKSDVKKESLSSSATPEPEHTEEQHITEPVHEPTPEPEPIWFTAIDDDDTIDVPEDWKFFQQFVYDGVNDVEIPTAISTAQSFVTSNIKQYQIQHPVFKNILTQLHYPFSSYQEKYLLSLPKDEVYFNPFDEIGKMMEIISTCFLPDAEKNRVVNMEDPDNCIVGRYIKAFETTDLDTLLRCITEFNLLIDTARSNGSIIQHTKSQNKIPRLAIYELLNQCYTRSVLPLAKKLSNYKAFSNEVYGELMPTFLTTVYSECGLNHKSVFIDLGSGVGNCVIQAALEFGCESYGVEIVHNASVLADAQLVEFTSRCKIFGFKPGHVKLFGNQSFIDNPPVKEVVDRCDVMLVNNYLFDAQLNKKVVDLLESCKVGTKIISLKPIVPATHKMTDYNIDSILNRMKTSKHIYGENSVSWTSKGGFYYLTEVMDGIQTEHLVHTSRSRRQQALESRSRSDTPLNAFTNNC